MKQINTFDATDTTTFGMTLDRIDAPGLRHGVGCTATAEARSAAPQS